MNNMVEHIFGMEGVERFCANKGYNLQIVCMY